MVYVRVGYTSVCASATPISFCLLWSRMTPKGSAFLSFGLMELEHSFEKVLVPVASLPKYVMCQPPSSFVLFPILLYKSCNMRFRILQTRTLLKVKILFVTFIVLHCYFKAYLNANLYFVFYVTKVIHHVVKMYFTVFEFASKKFVFLLVNVNVMCDLYALTCGGGGGSHPLFWKHVPFYFFGDKVVFFLETLFFGDIFTHFFLETKLSFFGDKLNNTPRVLATDLQPM